MKKRKVPRAVQARQQAPAAPNPFELKGSKRKWDVLGKRDKGDKKNVIKSREEAVNKRKKTLLVEYKQLRKANTFIDRRFGEDDPRLDEEDRALARFQAQRIREAKRATRFQLGGGGEGEGGGGALDTLTHGGRSLEELEELNARPADLLGDLDDDLLDELVQQYNFGGGEEEAAAAGEEGGGGDGQQRRKTKKEVMEEIIAKSKAAKAAKARQKEADEAALEALDSTFKALVSDRHQGGLGALVKPAGYDKGRKLQPETDGDAEYDRAARELVFEAKGQAGDRTLTAEELQEKEAKRLEVLEAARIKRMRSDAGGGGAGEEEEEEGGGGEADGAAPLPAGGYAAKRARLARLEEDWEQRHKRRQHASGDALEENFALSDEDGEGEEEEEDDDEDDEDGAAGRGGGAVPANALEARRREAAAGDHPLQQAFRQAAARLAAKYGAGGEDAGGDEGEDEEGESGGEGESESGGEGESESGGEGEEDEDEEEGSSSDEEGADGAADELPHPTKEKKRQQQAERQQQQQQPGQHGQHGAPAAAELEGPADLSFTPPVPESYQEFAALVAGRPADQLQLAVQRIRAFNAPALAASDKRKLQVFYGILVQHFAVLAGESPPPLTHLDALTRALLQLTPEVPIYAATVARARIERLHERLAAALADPLAAGELHGWPGARQLLQLRLFAVLFPTSDGRHPVTTPLALLTGKYLAQCPVAEPRQAGVGLLLAGMALANAAEASRFCPEALNFVAAALRAFVPAAAAGGGGGGAAAAAAPSPGASLFAPGVLALSTCAAAQSAGAKQPRKRKGTRPKAGSASGAADEQLPGLPKADLQQLLSLPPGAPELSSDEFKLGLLGASVATAERACQLSSGCGAAAPEVLQPLASAAAELLAVQGLPPQAELALTQLQQQLQGAIRKVVATRQPMMQSHRAKLVAPREFNPRFEADFDSRADYDPDRQRAQQRKLERQLVKERRGAMRELRRDASFMAAERDADKARVDAERLASERSFYSELQAQEADAKSGGQRGMNPHRKKGGK